MVALTANENKIVAALNADGTVVAWGASADTPAVADLLTDVQAIYPEAEGYLALKSDDLLGVTTLVGALPSGHPYKSDAPMAR